MRSNEQAKQEMFSHIAQWQQSGLTQKSYCLQNNIAYHIFHYWYKCYRDNYSPAKRTSFMPLQVEPASTIPMVELLLSDGKRILFHQPVSSDYLKSLIN